MVVFFGRADLRGRRAAQVRASRHAEGPGRDLGRAGDRRHALEVVIAFKAAYGPIFPKAAAKSH